MKRLAAIVAAGAALAALVAPVAALGQSGGRLKLTESPTSGFPDRAYLLTLPQTQPLSTAQLSVTENDGPVVGLGVQPPGGSSSGAVLLIDASNSMEGAPIDGAMAAARAFLAERKDDLPVSVVVFGPDDTVLAEFTTDRCLAQVDFNITRINALTGGHPTAAGIPISMPTDRDAIDSALETVGLVEPPRARVVQIPDTLHLRELLVSEAYTGELRERDDLEIVSGPDEMAFDGARFLRPVL